MGRFDESFDETWDIPVVKGTQSFPYTFPFLFDRDNTDRFAKEE